MKDNVFSPDELKIKMLEIDNVTQNKFIDLYSDELDEFVRIVSSAFAYQKMIDNMIEPDDIRTSYMSMLMYSSVNNVINSTNLFMQGHIVPSGNLNRIALENILMALLFSYDNLSTDYYMRFERNPVKFEANKVFRYLETEKLNLGLEDTFFEQVGRIKKWLNMYSHGSMFSNTFIFSMTENRDILGVSFEEKRIEQYMLEFRSRSDTMLLINYTSSLIVDVYGKSRNSTSSNTPVSDMPTV